jgi:dienelactone hydrolase
MDRRGFLQTAAALSAAGTVLAAETAAAQAPAPMPTLPTPAPERTGPLTKRWVEQRWVLDNVIQANGIDWDQPRSIYWNAPCGMEAGADFATIRGQVKKYAECSPAFEAAARRREARAHAAEEAHQTVTARDNYFIASIMWGAAQWPIDEANEQNLAYNQKKRDCYASYAKLADHKIEAVSIPFQGKALPGWFHLPPNYQGGRIPVVFSIPGMDSFKEASVALYGDRFLSRGIAVLALEGPGQYECPLLGIFMTVPRWEETARLVLQWLKARPEVDPEKIVVSGTSFGSFAGTIVASAEPGYRAIVVNSTALEPGWNTVFQEASPTFKMRFMFMSDYTDEASFDEFRKTLTWEGKAEKIKMPYLCLAGEADELSPLQWADRLMATMPAPKQLIVYQGSRHSVGGPAANLGPSPQSYAVDWLLARCAGESFPSERWYVESTGRVTKTAL